MTIPFFRQPVKLQQVNNLISALLVGHVFGLVFWVGGLLATSMALTRHTQEASAEARQALARLERIFLRGLADPGALLAVLAGAGLIMTNSHYYLHAPWLHIKLTFVLFLIALHARVAMRNKSLRCRTNRSATERSTDVGFSHAVPISVHPHSNPVWSGLSDLKNYFGMSNEAA